MLGLAGVTISAVTALVLINDASLSQTTSAGIQYLASANGDFISDFNVISITAITMTFAETVMTIRRIFKI